MASTLNDNFYCSNNDKQTQPPPRILWETQHTAWNAIDDNKDAIHDLLFEPIISLTHLMLQWLLVQDQQQHLSPPPKDPSPQLPALDLDPDCPGTSSSLHDTPSEPKKPSFDPSPFVWSHVQPFPHRQSFLFLLQELLPAQHLLLDNLPGCSFALDFMKFIFFTFVMLKIDDRYGDGWNKIVFDDRFGDGWHK